MSRIVCLHRVPKMIVSDRGIQFTLKFWERLHETLDTQLRFNSAYHSQTYGQTKRVNQILEDMLRACAMQYGRSWDKSLSYAKFVWLGRTFELRNLSRSVTSIIGEES
jgi:transposase InsO family protein